MNSKLGRFLRSSVNALLAPAEDPRNSYIDPGQQQRDLLGHIKTAGVRLSETRERLESQRDSIKASSELLDGEARQALAEGREDLARLALRRQRLCLTEIGKFDRQIEGLLEEEHHLAIVERRVRAQIETARVREEIAAVRRSAARAQVAAGEALSGIGPILDDTEYVEQIERNAEDLQARADAIEELIGAGILGQGTGLSEVSFTSGTSESAADAEIEARLLELKQEQSAKPS